MTGPWDAVERLFAEGLALPPAERESWLERSTRDPTLREELRTLWSAHEAVGRTLDPPLHPWPPLFGPTRRGRSRPPAPGRDGRGGLL